MGTTLTDLLLENPGKIISGNELSGVLRVSRQALWKQIRGLRKKGWEIEGYSGKGYRLRSTPPHVEYRHLKERLAEPPFWEEVHVCEKAGSTNTFLLERSERGVRRSIAIADFQEGGRGRMGREWFSLPGRNITMSILLPLEIPPARSPSITLVAGLSVASSLERETGLRSRVKWPNDLYLGRKKVCGILVEMVAESDRTKSVVIGVGMNVNMRREEFPLELAEKATSLLEEAGKKFSRPSLVALIARGLVSDLDNFEKSGLSPFLDEWGARSYLRGKRVEVDTGREIVRGVVAGIDKNMGYLLVKPPGGGVARTILSGEIDILEEG